MSISYLSCSGEYVKIEMTKVNKQQYQYEYANHGLYSCCVCSLLKF